MRYKTASTIGQHSESLEPVEQPDPPAACEFGCADGFGGGALGWMTSAALVSCVALGPDARTTIGTVPVTVWSVLTVSERQNREDALCRSDGISAAVVRRSRPHVHHVVGEAEDLRLVPRGQRRRCAIDRRGLR